MAVLNLAVQRWTILANVYPLTASPVALTGGQYAASADALAGDDRVTGTGNSNEQGTGSLLSNGRFYMSQGNDYFAGTGVAGAAGVAGTNNGSGGSGGEGICLTEGSILNTGIDVGLGLLFQDNDTVVGNGGAGGSGAVADDSISGAGGGDGGTGIDIVCGSTVITGVGRDSITGTGGAGGTGGNAVGGVSNGGDGGDGGDGIYVSKSSSISTGDGADSITGIGGTGGDGGAGFGGGNAGADGASGAGIYNKGTISMGAGCDTLDALKGGFEGCGTYNMGSANDVVKGFGKGTFYGDSGWDKLILPGVVSDYTISLINAVQTDFTVTNNTTQEVMTLYSFESIGFTPLT